MGKRIVPIILIVLLVLIVAALLLIFFGAFPAAPDPDAVRSNIEQLQTLTTTRYEYREVVYFDQQTRVLGIPAGSRELLFSVQIDVVAGIELGRGVAVDHGDGWNGEVFVTLPAPQIIRVTAREETIDQYFVRSGFSGIDWLHVTDLLEEAKARNRDDAVRRGILERAQNHGEVIVRGILNAAGYDRVHIRFRPLSTEDLRG